MQSQNTALDSIKSKLNHLKRQTWKPIMQVGEGALNASKVSGKAWLNRAKPGLFALTVKSLCALPFS